jgi:hypothetical protein
MPQPEGNFTLYGDNPGRPAKGSGGAVGGAEQPRQSSFI